ncbi:hypothetical protein ZIOFF_067225 [Zingiber officinale]|uniref:Uncharacterized protein n=1 Tax=Zingiber officinale TaxID=94328 RepID=A0A8J5EVE6_ZINOF|nr:hypothetical protein ZIOFF_067225 [Zingiber officinale]
MSAKMFKKRGLWIKGGRHQGGMLPQRRSAAFDKKKFEISVLGPVLRRSCREGICSSCSMNIDGRLAEAEENAGGGGKRVLAATGRKKLDGLYECILCACCSAAWPAYWWKTEAFLGPPANVDGLQTGETHGYLLELPTGRERGGGHSPAKAGDRGWRSSATDEDRQEAKGGDQPLCASGGNRRGVKVWQREGHRALEVTIGLVVAAHDADNNTPRDKGSSDLDEAVAS